jgi:hypothetical protein
MVELVFTEIDADNDNGKEWGSEVFLFLEWQLTFDSNKFCGGRQIQSRGCQGNVVTTGKSALALSLVGASDSHALVWWRQRCILYSQAEYSMHFDQHEGDSTGEWQKGGWGQSTAIIISSTVVAEDEH